MLADTPYKSQPDRAFWRRSVCVPDWEAVDPVDGLRVKISKDAKIATAGSCFAQHIAKHLSLGGFNYYVTEPGHPLLSPELRRKYNYGMFSARYGNVYTAAQLNQMFKRAFGEFKPSECDWQLETGRWIDPFRPNITEGGFSSQSELRHDRQSHFSAVRELLLNADVFVFTLGLTEAWRSREDGSVFPLCPGVRGGVFDDTRYEFVNFEFDEVVQDLLAFIESVKKINKKCLFIITVSPIPLMATASDQHVLVATTISKSVLRAAADYVRRKVEDVFYFPSYEIITGAHTRGRYFASDLREIEKAGVRRVMDLFLKHVFDVEAFESKGLLDGQPITPEEDVHLDLGEKLMGVLCDEEMLDR